MAEASGCLSGYGRQFLHDHGLSVFPRARGWAYRVGLEEGWGVVSVQEVSESDPFLQVYPSPGVS